MVKYAPEVRAAALDMIRSVGISRTCHEMHITKQTLLRWRKQNLKKAPGENTQAEESPAETLPATSQLESMPKTENLSVTPIDDKLRQELNDMQHLNQVSEATIEYLVNENRLLRQRCEKYLHALSLITQ